MKHQLVRLFEVELVLGGQSYIPPVGLWYINIILWCPIESQLVSLMLHLHFGAAPHFFGFSLALLVNASVHVLASSAPASADEYVR